jgi:hypothetical protein
MLQLKVGENDLMWLMAFGAVLVVGIGFSGYWTYRLCL